MCLISVCPRGTEKNTEEVERFIRKGFGSNEDGSGYMFKKAGDHSIFLAKGFFNLNQLLSSIEKHNLKKDDELVIHHRIRTSGDRNAANCHPFVVTSVKDQILMTEGKTIHPVLAHNGIFQNIGMLEANNYGYSDTFTFCKDVLGDKGVLELFLKDQKKFEYLFKHIISGSRLALLLPDRELIKVGHWEEDNGYFHSNGGYKTYVRNVGGVEHHRSTPVTTNNPKLLPGGKNSTNSGTHQAEYLPIVEANAGYYTPMFQLTIKDINITKRNYDHFYFVRKTDRYNGVVLEFKHFKNYDKDHEANYLVQVGNPGMMHEVKKARLYDYYFYPKLEYNSIYKDYTYLMEILPEVGKKTVKKLYKGMSKMEITNTKETLYLKRVGKAINKYAIYMFYDFHADFWAQPSLDIVFEKADWAKVVKNIGLDKADKMTMRQKTSHCCTFPRKEDDTEFAVSAENIEELAYRGPMD